VLCILFYAFVLFLVASPSFLPEDVIAALHVLSRTLDELV
jgi:hypothetical protein